MPKRLRRMGFILDTNILCDYGCKQSAHFQFLNRKVCCEDHSEKCPAKKRAGSDHPNFGKEPWLKGLTKEDHPGIALQAEKLRGRKKTEEHKKKISDALTGLEKSETAKKNMSISAKVRANKPEHMERLKTNNPMHDPKIVKKAKTTYDAGDGKNRKSKAMLKVWSNPKYKESLSGPNHSGWLGGISKEPYGLEFNKDLKERIRDRDKRVCQFCERTEKENIKKFGSILDVHHIDYDKSNHDEFNLISLCKSCHTKACFDRGFWREYYQKLMVERGLGKAI